ncbi:zinc finger protein 25-like [Hetaerina americana]|uniref:zinc finger protein 25-like n=1 Tax=Hetaerina americana TaxID=62018 RepID=UPI003A7F3216
MCDKIDFVVCRLCLNSGGVLINIFDKNNKPEFMLENTIEDLINVKVVEDANYPWLVCSTCMKKLTEFRLFKNRCAECLFVYYNRIQKGFNPGTEGWLTNRQEEMSDVLTQDNKNPGEHMVDGTSDKVWALSSTVESAVHTVGTASAEMKNPYSPVHGMNFMAVNNCNEVNIQLPGEIKKEIEDETLASDAVDGSEVDVQDDMIIVKEEIDTTSGCPVPLKISTDSSIQEGDSHWSDNEDSSHLVFEQRDLLKDHVMHVHLNKVMQFKCDVCFEVFKRKKHLESHMKLVPALKKKHQCEFCAKNFRNLSRLKRHILTHNAERPFQCALCLKGFAKNINLQMHMLTHTGERPHRCEICSKGFALNSSLKRHMLTHTDGKRYKCDVCLKAFAYKCFLKDHILTHTGQRPHKCNICSKAFTQRSHLKSHMITHTGETPHKCHICSKPFATKGSLRGHILTHTGEKPHKCDICSKDFTRSNKLKSHMLAHSGEKPHKCLICFKAFAMGNLLKRHMKTHTGERPHKCNVCSKAFIQRCRLISHMKTHSVVCKFYAEESKAVNVRNDVIPVNEEVDTCSGCFVAPLDKSSSMTCSMMASSSPSSGRRGIPTKAIVLGSPD